MVNLSLKTMQLKFFLKIFLVKFIFFLMIIILYYSLVIIINKKIKNPNQVFESES